MPSFSKSAAKAALPMILMLSGLNAQETRGSIQGTVSDSSGAIVANATVTATNIATNVSISAATSQEGRFNLLFLLSGKYRIDVAAPGFKAVQRDNVELRI